MGGLARLAAALARVTPAATGAVYAKVGGGLMRRHPNRVLDLLRLAVPPPDRDVLGRRDVREVLIDACREGFSGGGRGPASDLGLYARPWGIDLTRISVPVSLWHGVLDRTVPVEMGRRIAAAVPGCQAKFLSGEGHYSLPVRLMAPILSALRA